LAADFSFVGAAFLPRGCGNRGFLPEGLEMNVVTTWESIPAFADEPAEAQFWLSHRLDPKLIEHSVIGPDQSESTTITLRIDPRMLARLKRLARSRYLNYQSMMKQWLSERMEAELREREGR
jgi:predicted DNA binding CopG/RHH family protein